MQEIQSPNSFAKIDKISVFLGGSIEMDTAEKWQDRLKSDLSETDVVLLNPRRNDWDNSIVQRAYDPSFSEQVNWELDAIDSADLIVFYFDPNTKSPITLMELGLFANSGKVIVCCPDGFWRKGNVEIVCSRSEVPLVNTYEQLVSCLKLLISVGSRTL
jgi:nucleoside 2-deoxyribosyltransferase